MELDLCIKGRRSVRSYLDRPVPKEVIDGLLDAAVWAPSGMNEQPWRFTVIQDREVIESLSRKTRELVMKSMPFLEESEAASKSERDMIFYGAPLLIFISVKKSPNPLWRVVNFLDCGLAAQNMFLFACSGISGPDRNSRGPRAHGPADLRLSKGGPGGNAKGGEGAQVDLKHRSITFSGHN